MQRIAHVSSVHGASSSRILHKECRTLAEAGYEVVYLVGEAPTAPCHGVRFAPLETPRGGPAYPRRLRSAWRAARDLDADLYHLHDPELLPLGMALAARGKRVVYDVHEDSPREALSLHGSRPVYGRAKAACLWLLESAARRVLHAFVCATPGIARRFPGDRTVQVRNFPIPGELDPLTQALRYRDRPPHAVYLGGLSPIRGLSETLDALLHLPEDVRLQLAGRFSDAGFRAEMDAHPGWKRVDYAGYLDRSGVRALLHRARVGIALLHPTPEHRLSYPVKLFEYMAAGIPVLASDFPLWREFVCDTGCGLVVDPRDPEAIAAALQRLLADPDEAREMGERGRAATQERYAWGPEGERLVALYRRLLGTPAADGS